MTSEKSYDNAQRIDALVARVASLEAAGSGFPAARNTWVPGVTATAVSFTNIGAYTIQPADTALMSVHEVEIWGNGQQGTVGNRQSLQFQCKIAGVSYASVAFGTTAMPDVGAIFRFDVKVRFICQSPGVSGVMTSYVRASISQFNVNVAFGNSNFDEAVSCEGNTTNTQDTTSAFDLGCSVAWGGTGGSPTLTSQMAIATRLS